MFEKPNLLERERQREREREREGERELSAGGGVVKGQWRVTSFRPNFIIHVIQ
jgi:hypothetical protein